MKIVRTAEALSRAGAPTCVVTDDRDAYWRFTEGRPERVEFGPRFRAAEEWPPLPALSRQAARICARVGYPREEHFLYQPLFDPTWWARALQVGRMEGIDVFQAEFPGYGVAAWLAARALSRLRVRAGGPPARSSIVQHNVEWERLAAFGHEVGAIKRVEQWVLDRVDEVIAVSLDDKVRMVGAGTDPNRITVIPHGVDCAPFAQADPAGLRARYGLAVEAPLLFFHGTLHYWPNTEAVRFLAEQLLPRLQDRLPLARVMVTGMNPPRYYAHPSMIFTGPVDDLPVHVAAADLALCPVAHGGGTRMKLLEYMAAGKAIVSFAKGAEGIQYVDGRELVIADGADAFADQVVALIEQPDRRARMGRAAARFAAAFDWQEIAQAYLGTYAGEGRGGDWTPRLVARATPPVDDHLPLRTPSKPLTMLLLLNKGCNLRCTFCDLWEEHIQMPVRERLVPLLDEAAAIGTRTLVITGGEPFLHKDLFLAVEEAKARGMGVNITTNGTLVEKRWEELVRSGVDSLSFSLDGLSTTHDALRGQAGAWVRTLRALDRVIAHGGIAVSVYMVVTRTNVRELVPLYELVKARGVAFDFWPVNDAPDLYLRSPEDQAAWREAVAALAAREPEVAARHAYYLEGLAYHAGEVGPVRCLGFVDQFGVTYAGDLLPCCVWGGEGLVRGNVFETPLSTLWTSPEVQEARTRMHGQGCAAGCWNHSLYEYLVSTGEPFEIPAVAS